MTNVSNNEMDFKNIIVKHNKIFIGIISGLVMILLSVISWVYIQGENSDAKWKNNMMILFQEHLEESKSVKISNDAIKKYILLRDDISIDKIEDQQLWDDLIKELKKESNIRGVKMKEVIDTSEKTYRNLIHTNSVMLKPWEYFQCYVPQTN